jgi:hypothetical protein
LLEYGAEFTEEELINRFVEIRQKSGRFYSLDELVADTSVKNCEKSEKKKQREQEENIVFKDESIESFSYDASKPEL